MFVLENDLYSLCLRPKIVKIIERKQIIQKIDISVILILCSTRISHALYIRIDPSVRITNDVEHVPFQSKIRKFQ